MITITDSAVKQLQQLLDEKSSDENSGLRIHVEKGGCAGWQYSMDIGTPESHDEVVEREGVRVIIDKESASLIKDSVVDYNDDLTGSGFKIRNPQAVRSCGCGSSFETS